MREVACSVLDVVFQDLRDRQVDPSIMTAGTPYTLEHLRQRHERIDWKAYLQIMANVSQLWTDEDLIDMGGRFTRSKFLRAWVVIARLLFTPLDFYRWLVAGKKAEGGGYQMFTCIDPSFREVGERKVQIALTMQEGYEPCREFFVITKGAFAAFPRLLGLGLATVQMQLSERGAVYDIQYPKGGGALSWVWKGLSWPFTARAAARELKDAHASLVRRYGELQDARAVLDRQATELRTAHRISTLVHADLDLDRTLQAVVEALVDDGGFVAAGVAIAADVEGNPVIRTVNHGESRGQGGRLTRPLVARGRSVGELTLWTRESSPGEHDELLTYVVPTVATAVDAALTFTAVNDYRENLERKVQTRTAELALAHDRLTESVEELERAQSARERIFSNINHEIRTPLSLITMAVTAIRRSEGDELEKSVSARLDAIRDSVDRLLNMIDGLLLLAAGTEGKLRLRRQQHDIAAHGRRLVSVWSLAAQEAGVSMRYDGPDSAIASCDEAALERILTNLLSNAIKFTPAGGSISLEVAPVEDAVEILVRDTGVGLADDFRERAFDRFEQGRAPVRQAASGSGIGLSIVRELVEAHGGQVKAETNRGGGTIFRVRLPSSAPTVDEQPTDDGSTVQPPTAAPDELRLTTAPDVRGVVPARAAGASASILVAEDEPSLRASLVELLSEKYNVVAACNGLEALDLAEKHHPDLLLTDLNMPGMDGVELTRRFRDATASRLAPVVMLTAFGGLHERLSGLEAGAVDFVVKPVEPAELLARVEAQLKIRNLALRLHDSERLASLAVLSAGLAHEIRNPANVMLNAIEPLRRQLPPETLEDGAVAAQLLDVMEQSASHVGVLSRELLGLARSDSPEYDDVRVDQLVERTLAILPPRNTSFAVERDLAYSGHLRCSRALVVQVLANLLENAMHAAGDEGTVRIASRRNNGDLVLEVTDSGPGVPVELRERIFDPFFTTKPAGRGTGLGLPTSRRIIERHGGTLSVVEGSTGTAFRVTLPISGTGDLEREREVSEPGAREGTH